MARQMSRRKRKEAFLAAASEMYEELEKWYDEHPGATYGEIEKLGGGGANLWGKGWRY